MTKAVFAAAQLSSLGPVVEALGMILVTAQAPGGDLVEVTAAVRSLASGSEAPTSVFDLYHPEDHPGLSDGLARAALGTGTTGVRQVRTRGSGGRWWSERTGALATSAGPLWIAMLTPTSHEASAGSMSIGSDQALLHWGRLESLGKIAPRVGHDCNNLLMVVLGHADLILATLDVGSVTALRSVHEDAEQASRAARSAGDLMRQLVDFARPAPERIAPFRLDLLLRELASLLKVVVRKPIAVVLGETLASETIEGNSGEIRQLITNLVLRSAESVGHERGRITVGLTVADLSGATGWSSAPEEGGAPRYLILEVADNGAALSEETRTALLEPSTEPPTLDEAPIAVIPRIARRHRARIRAETSAAGGASISIAFPLSS